MLISSIIEMKRIKARRIVTLVANNILDWFTIIYFIGYAMN